MKKTIALFIRVFFVLFISKTQVYAAPYPTLDPAYGTDVEVWWGTHPFNPESPTYVPIGGIDSPTPVVNVQSQYGGNIQNAINALPATGGTLFFDPGTYTGVFDLIGKNNVHFISNGGAIIRGGSTTYDGTNYQSPMFIGGCPLAKDYGTFSAYVVHGSGVDGVNARACASVNRIKNIYFKNLTFDGGGTAVYSVRLAAANGVVFDNVKWQNFIDPGASHMGLIVAHAVVDNIWVRGGSFIGNGKWATYSDGCHFCGVVESKVDYNFSDGGFLYMSNNDFSFDQNQNGRIDYHTTEDRMANYVVIANNTFGEAGANSILNLAMTMGGSNVLVKKNNFLRSVGTMVRYYGECQIQGSHQFNYPNQNSTIHYTFENHRTIGNTGKEATYFVDMDGSRYNCFSANGLTSSMEIGKYEVRDNIVAAPNLVNFVRERNGTIDGPNCTVNNTVNGAAYPNSGTCSSPTVTYLLPVSSEERVIRYRSAISAKRGQPRQRGPRPDQCRAPVASLARQPAGSARSPGSRARPAAGRSTAHARP